jgi:hypothetical protein
MHAGSLRGEYRMRDGSLLLLRAELSHVPTVSKLAQEQHNLQSAMLAEHHRQAGDD